jgi:hypothetical protein
MRKRPRTIITKSTTRQSQWLMLGVATCLTVVAVALKRPWYPVAMIWGLAAFWAIFSEIMWRQGRRKATEGEQADAHRASGAAVDISFQTHAQILLAYRAYKRCAIYFFIYGFIHAGIAHWAGYPAGMVAVALVAISGGGAFWFWKLRRVPLKSTGGISEQRIRSGGRS